MNRSLFLLLIMFSLLNCLIVKQVCAQNDEDVPEVQIDIVLGIDKIQRLDFIPDSRITVGNLAILEYQLIPSKRELIFKGLKDGQTSVIVRNKVGDVKAKYMVTVKGNNQSRIVQDLKEFLGDVEGLEIGIKGGKVYVGGELVVPNDIGLIDTVLANFKDVIKIYELSPQTKRVIGQKMQEEIARAGMKDVKVRLINKVFWLEGVVKNDAEKELAQKIAEGFIPDGVQSLSAGSSRAQKVSGRALLVNFVSVNPAKQKPPPPTKLIKIVAQFVELSKDYNKVFGFKWTPALAPGGGSIQFGKTTSDGVTTKSDGTFSGTISNLFPRLAAAKAAGYARVIQSGMLIVKDGHSSPAVISKENQTPFVLGSGEFQRPQSQSTGFQLTINAKIGAKEQIEMGVGIGVNMAAGANGSTSNKIQTELIAKSKESAVIGGIAINESKTNYDKDPPFGTDQVEGDTGFPLFSFLRSKSYSVSKSQFVVFITPEIVTNPSNATAEIKRKFRQRRR